VNEVCRVLKELINLQRRHPPVLPRVQKMSFLRFLLSVNEYVCKIKLTAEKIQKKLEIEKKKSLDNS
jgi:hypothetical protein